MKIIHTADIHLDSPLRSLAFKDPRLSDLVQNATRQALKQIVDVAIELEVIALLIAGDLYDGAERSAKTAAFLLSQLGRLQEANIHVFYIKGNHDAENPITGELTLPSNVHVFDGRGDKVQIPDTDIWIHGVSFSGKHAPDSLLPRFNPPVPGAINIGMLHTSLAGAAGHDPYAPCTVADLSNHGFDYWALGHVHKRQVHSSQPWIVMPGMPQGRDIGEAGAKTASLLTISDGAISVSEIATSQVMFQDCALQVDDLRSTDELRIKMRNALSETASTITSDQAILRMTITGQTELRWELLRDADAWQETAVALAEDAGNLWIEKLIFDLSPPSAKTDHSGALDTLEEMMGQITFEDSFAAEATREVEAMIADLPPAVRKTLAPDEDRMKNLLQDSAEEGTDTILAMMRGASV
ncbi:metallophosphoesterase family protein [Donghicola tyrosinivorans]|uniref:DNA repair exonuclease SbcCD nuclease subunit n=1 Tax=Donghicola tyrosinivorans TaxID=1652492 RepID=A0A2T0WPP6_9RHOB|nr:DNA repair exonuclease [Donghicola tyrosinivorans]PRY88660.1 DNA repair exonuclease SbcCD nuclease subunit [Donghicola tyrosinivorans]